MLITAEIGKLSTIAQESVFDKLRRDGIWVKKETFSRKFFIVGRVVCLRFIIAEVVGHLGKHNLP